MTKEVTPEQLKARAYDLLVQIQTLQNELVRVNQAIEQSSKKIEK